MQANKHQEKIKTLMAAKDHMERAQAILRVEGYNTSNHTYERLSMSIMGLKNDIIGLQTGVLPLITIEY